MTLHDQFSSIGLMVICGLGIAFIFDFYRVFFRIVALPRWAQPIIDMIYWLIATCIVFGVLIHGNDGQVRVYIYLSVCVGVCAYYAFCSSWIIKCLATIIRCAMMIIQSSARCIAKTFNVVIVIPIKICYHCTYVFLGFLMMIALFILKIMVQLIYPTRKIFLWFISLCIYHSRLNSLLSIVIKKIIAMFRRLFWRNKGG